MAVYDMVWYNWHKYLILDIFHIHLRNIVYAPGVPISEAVAGIACGMITESDENGNIIKHKVLTDLLGFEVRGRRTLHYLVD